MTRWIVRYPDEKGDGVFVRYCVKNGDTIGTYGVYISPDGTPKWPSRDVHVLATPESIAARAAYEAWLESDDDEAPMPASGASTRAALCEYHGGRLAHCDGSGLVEATTDSDQCWKIAEMMAK